MKRLFFVFTMGALMASCGGKEKKEEEKGGFEMSRTKTETKAEEVAQEIPVDLSNKGVGPVKSVEFGAEIDKELAAKGEQRFNTVCTACHMPDQRMIGPALKGVFERRSPEWVMNMIINPDVMIKEDPIAQALLKEYNNAIMLNQNLSEEDARALAEYLRTF